MPSSAHRDLQPRSAMSRIGAAMWDFDRLDRGISAVTIGKSGTREFGIGLIRTWPDVPAGLRVDYGRQHLGRGAGRLIDDRNSCSLARVDPSLTMCSMMNYTSPSRGRTSLRPKFLALDGSS
jgi:hypothetical protein